MKNLILLITMLLLGYLFEEWYDFTEFEVIIATMLTVNTIIQASAYLKEEK